MTHRIPLEGIELNKVASEINKMIERWDDIQSHIETVQRQAVNGMIKARLHKKLNAEKINKKPVVTITQNDNGQFGVYKKTNKGWRTFQYDIEAYWQFENESDYNRALILKEQNAWPMSILQQQRNE